MRAFRWAAAHAALVVLAYGTTLADEPSAKDPRPAKPAIRSDEPAKILERIAAAIRSNQSKVRTWSSKWTLEETLTHPGFGRDTDPFGSPYSVTVKGAVRFDADLTAGKVSMEFRPSTEAAYRDIATGTPLDSARITFGGMYRAVITPEHILSCDYQSNLLDVDGFPSIPDLPASISRVTYREPTRLKEKRPHLFDCRNFFKLHQGGFNYVHHADFLDIYRAKLNDPHLPEDIGVDDIRNLVSVTAADEGDHTIYTLRIRYLDRRTQKEMFVTEVAFDSSAGMNPVSETSIVFPQEKPFRQTLRHYKTQDGVFIPDVVTMKSWDYNDPDSPAFRESRVFTLQTTTLNKPIPPEAFSSQQFQWKYGDRFCDRIENKLSVFDGETLVPAEDFQYLPLKDARLKASKAAAPEHQTTPANVSHKNQAGATGNQWLIIINVVVIAAICVAFFAWSRRRIS